MAEGSERTTFRLPRTAYLVVVFVAVGVWPLALSGGGSSPGTAGPATAGPLLLLFLIPAAAAAYIARTATVVDGSGITVRALLGRRHMPWAQIRGVAVRVNTVYAVLPDGAVRLPCVHLAHLSALTEAGGEHLPQLDPPPVKQPPARQRRR